jgi:hypothetical protein
MRGSVTRADTRDDDEYGHRRSSHIGEAVKIGAVSAQIVVALGKYAGEFNHNINVKRSDEERPRTDDAKAPPDNTRLGCALRRKRLGIEDDDNALPEGLSRRTRRSTARSENTVRSATQSWPLRQPWRLAPTIRCWIGRRGTPSREFGFEWLSPKLAANAAVSPETPIAGSTVSMAAPIGRNMAKSLR